MGLPAAAPKRLPKTREEREFDNMMRNRRPSVWEDKGSVGDMHFRSLKGAARHITDENELRSRYSLPPLSGATEPAFEEASSRRSAAQVGHEAGTLGGAAQRVPQKHRGGTNFDGFMRSTLAKHPADGSRKEKRKKTRSVSVPPELGGTIPPPQMGGGVLPQHIRKLLAPSKPKWESLSVNECGRPFGERNSAALGANLFRLEREEAMKHQAQGIDYLLHKLGDASDIDSMLKSRVAAANTELPALHAGASRLKLGAGYVKFDAAQSHAVAAMSAFKSVQKPWRERDEMSPPVNVKARRQVAAREAEEDREMAAMMARKRLEMRQDQEEKAQAKAQRRALLLERPRC